MSTTEDTMSSDRAPPERPAPSPDAQDDTIDAERHDPLSGVEMAPGDRRTDNVELLVIEAELVDDGKQLDNPAKPRTEGVGEQFRERLDDTGLVPAWTRPWEQDGGAD